MEKNNKRKTAKGTEGKKKELKYLNQEKKNKSQRRKKTG